MPLSDAGSVLICGEHSSLAEVEEQVARITGSQAFRNSTLLHSFLRFVTGKAMSGTASDINEYTIATQVFGRAPAFNPSVDTIVRTQAYRLRQKLDEYYRTEGATDPIIITIPKGHYVPIFQSREPDELSAPAEISSPHHLPAPAIRHRNFWLLSFVAVLAFTGGALFPRWLNSGKTAPPFSAPAPSPATPVDQFWRSFLQSDKEPIVAYTNPLYLANDRGDLFVFRKGAAGDRGAIADPDTTRRLLKERKLLTAGPLYFADDITGVSDLLAAVLISNELIRAGATPALKRGRLLTTYDLENHNVIFIGSPFVNEVLDDLPNRPRFLFARTESNHGLWTGRIDDTAPRQNAPASYSIERAPETGRLVSDYGVVTGLPGLKPGRRILIFAGLTTSGTAAAARCATSSEGISEMKHRLPGARDTWPAYFEYLLKVQLNRGLDVVSWRFVAAHF